MSKKNNNKGRQYSFDLEVNGQRCAYFQNYDGPSLTNAEHGSRILKFRNGVVASGALRELQSWYRAMTRGEAAARDIVVSDFSTFDKATFALDGAEFFDAAIVSLIYHESGAGSNGVKIEELELHYSHYRPIHG